MVLSKGVKCFGLLLACSIMLGLSLSVCLDTNAAQFPINYFELYGQSSYGSSNAWTSSLSYSGASMHSVYRWKLSAGSVTSANTGKYVAYNFSGFINVPSNFSVNLNQGFDFNSCTIGSYSASLSNINTSWSLIPAQGSDPPMILWSASAVGEFSTNNVSGDMVCTFSSNNGVYFLQHQTNGVGTVSFGTNNFNATFSNTLTDELLQFQIEQNQIMIEGIGQTTDAVNNLRDTIESQNEKEDTAIDNIDNQSSSDIPGSSNSQTTSIIGFVGDFVSALGTVQPSNCTLTLPFPQFAGGSKTVNVCSGKEQAPTIVAIGASLLLIGTFIPLAFIVLKMIYNEIRSWTNG